MSEWKETPFEELLTESKDGEWGKGEGFIGWEQVEVIRGTDFSRINNPEINLPIRWVKGEIVKRKRLYSGDILIETAGGTATQSTGRTALLKQSFFKQHDKQPVLCASFSRFLRLKTEKYNPVFIYYLLQALYEAGYMAVYNIQHTGVSRFQYTTFKNKTVLKIPSLPIQKKIAAVLSAYDDLIENNDRRITLLEKMAEEIYREWFVRLRFPGHGQVTFNKGVPENWEKKRFAEFCLLQRGFDITQKEQIAGNVPIVSSSGITSFHNKVKVKGPGVVTGRKGTLGKVFLIDCDYWPHDTTLWVKDTKGNSLYFIYYLLSLIHLEVFDTGASNPTLNRNHLGSQYLVVPPQHLQKRFESVVKPMLEQKRYLEKATSVLKQTRDRLLTRLISGKLSVEDLDIQFPPSMTDLQ